MSKDISTGDKSAPKGSNNPIHNELGDRDVSEAEMGGSRTSRRGPGGEFYGSRQSVHFSVPTKPVGPASERKVMASKEIGHGEKTNFMHDMIGEDATPAPALKQRHIEAADPYDVDYSWSHEWRVKHRSDLKGHELSEDEQILMQSFEGLDYDQPISDVTMGAQLQSNQNRTRNIKMAKWFLTFLIGCMTGLTGFLINIVVGYLSKLKFDVTHNYVNEGGHVFGGYVIQLFISLGFVTISTVLVNFVEPVATGSGIPEVKGYLNGTNYLRLLTIKTALVKFVGVIFSVSSGLIIGKEGPLIHMGSCIGANFATLPGVRKFNFFQNQLWPLRFRNDRDKRDFVSSGAAAGVAAAFGSPTGGLCFAMEEASSFWQLSLTWKTYFCTALSCSSIWLLTAWYLNVDSYHSFVKYGWPGDKFPFFRLWQLPFVGFLSLMGGLLGAAFCECNQRLTHWRLKHVIGNKPKQIAQVLLIVFLTVTLTYWLPQWMPSCATKVPNWTCTGYENKYYCGSQTARTAADVATTTAGTGGATCQYECEDKTNYIGFGCANTDGNTGQFNPLSTLMQQPWEEVIKALFHNEAAYPKELLVLYLVVVFFLANITYGISVPSGLFVPCILMGAGFGRLQGEIMRELVPDGNVHPGIWAMLGAGSMLSGVTRITITITVILYETTGEWSLILPTMAIVIMAKNIADIFNISLYDMHVEMKCIPFVEPQPPKSIEGLEAKDVMNSPVKSVELIPTVHSVIKLLQSCRHNGFCVLSDKQKMRGLILRNQLVILLRYYDITNGGKTKEEILRTANNADDDWKYLLPEEAFAVSLSSKTMRVTDVEDLLESLPDTACVDLRPYMNRAPLFITERSPILRAYGIVRGMGVRHIPVVNDEHFPVGMITRKELMTDFNGDLL